MATPAPTATALVWTARGAGGLGANSWECVGWGNNQYVAVASDGTNRIMKSSDSGATWAAVAGTAANAWKESPQLYFAIAPANILFFV